MRLILLLVTCILIVGLHAAVLQFDITFKAKPDCDAGDRPIGDKHGKRTVVQNSKYRVLEALIYWTDNSGKITNYVSCNVPSSTGCTGTAGSSGKVYLVLVVTLVKSSFEDQNIHYQYFDELFELGKLDVQDTHTSPQIHKLDNFLYPVSARLKSDNKVIVNFDAKNCLENRSKSLISGHGYFITEIGDSDKSWHNLYYLPHLVGQYIKFPTP